MTFFIYVSIWFCHQAHKGGKLQVGHMNKAYYWKTLGTYTINKNDLKLLDNQYQIKENLEFHKRDMLVLDTMSVAGNTNSSPINLMPLASEYEALRIGATFSIANKEWNVWNMTQLVADYKLADKTVKYQYVRLQRILDQNSTNEIWLDTNIPSIEYDEVNIYIRNEATPNPIDVSSMWVEYYE